MVPFNVEQARMHILYKNNRFTDMWLDQYWVFFCSTMKYMSINVNNCYLSYDFLKLSSTYILVNFVQLHEIRLASGRDIIFLYSNNIFFCDFLRVLF